MDLFRRGAKENYYASKSQGKLMNRPKEVESG
jgi:hypothetical protein